MLVAGSILELNSSIFPLTSFQKQLGLHFTDIPGQSTSPCGCGEDSCITHIIFGHSLNPTYAWCESSFTPELSSLLLVTSVLFPLFLWVRHHYMAWCWFVTRSHDVQVISPWQSLVTRSVVFVATLRITSVGLGNTPNLWLVLASCWASKFLCSVSCSACGDVFWGGEDVFSRCFILMMVPLRGIAPGHPNLYSPSVTLGSPLRPWQSSPDCLLDEI